jgi:pimeloyl-ACP methyl ester carboxylesterase
MLLLTLTLLTATLLTAPVDSIIIRNLPVAPGELLRTTSVGSGPPVVLIPAIYGSAFGYRRITGPLVASGYRTIVVEPLGYGWSSHPKQGDYSFTAQTERVAKALDQLGVKRALLVAQSSGASIAFRLAILRPDLVRGLLSIDGGPMESAATPEMKKAFKFGGLPVKLAVDETRLRYEVRRMIVRNSGDTTWVTAAVIRGYTAGQAADMHGAIDAIHQMSKSTESESLAGRLRECKVPVRLLVGTVAHPTEVSRDERALLSDKLPDFKTDSVPGSGQYIHEEQPAAVLAAVARLDQASR